MRQSGHYWVNLKGTWWIGYYSATTKLWQLPGNPARYQDNQLDEIKDERIEEP